MRVASCSRFLGLLGAALLVLATGCTSTDAILLTITADGPVTDYAINVYDDATQKVVFQSGFQPVSPTNSTGPIDLTKQKLKVALKLSSTGSFKMQVLGKNDTTMLFWAGHVSVNGATSVSASLITVKAGDDLDGDTWPDVTKFVADTPAAATLYAMHPELLDCWDDSKGGIEAPTPEPSPVGLTPSQFNPFATDLCGDGLAENCVADEPCVDKDHDHDPATDDCDDNDPARHHPTLEDPYPDPPNCCGYNMGKKGTADEGTSFLCPTGTCYAAKCDCDMMLCPKQRCGDGIDESCQGADTTCIIDEDCDGYPAPPQGDDCDDHDPTVHPGALEPCGSTKDLNCDGVIGGGCLPCDIDGDGYERMDTTNNCPDSKNLHPGVFDCNDYDAGVFPGQTSPSASPGGNPRGNGTEAGTGLGRIINAERGNCSHVYGLTPSPAASPIAKISSFGWLVGDADCNGTAYQGCPDPSCDADGDGFPDMTKTDATTGQPCTDPAGQYDCDDNNPSKFPGAPISCGSGPAEDCVSQRTPCDANDADHDGWEAGVDCDDGDPNTHPWAPEICDGKDNNCNGLTDEQNPDNLGNALVTAGVVTQCTDFDNGVCGTEKGSCVCSIVSPAAATGTPRTFCPGEQAGGKDFPHCFGAGQPKPQSCNAVTPLDDDCDGHVDDPSGKNLAVLGLPCGSSVGQCRPGTIIGCDMTKTNCFVAAGIEPQAQAWYVCSSDAVCPTPEICNGLDDNCDGVIPGVGASAPGYQLPVTSTDEADHDKDGFMACTNCPPSGLATGIKGCNDCDDTHNTVYPGAMELCDGLNNACATGWTTSTGLASDSNPNGDGKDQCGQTASSTCCSTTGACTNLDTTSNCINCGSACSSATAANICDTTKGCICGTSGRACNSNESCVAGTCECLNNNACGGAAPYCWAVATPGSPASDGACHATQQLGATCTSASQCQSNFCVDGVCCNSACSGPGFNCSVCNGAGGSGPVGTCSNYKGTTPYSASGTTRACANVGVAPCGGSCSATGAAADCQYPTNMIAASCNAGNTVYTAVGMCNGAGSETGGATTTCPTGLTCNTTDQCASCTQQSDCGTGYYCNGAHTCVTLGNLGDACSGNAQCGSGHCTDNVCCSKASCQTCQTCQPASAGATKGQCEDSASSVNGCMSPNQCDGSGDCRTPNSTTCTTVANGTSVECISGNCVQDGTPGTAKYCCFSGTCTGTPTCADGTHVTVPSCASGTCGTTTVACSNGMTCVSGACTSVMGNGGTCSMPGDDTDTTECSSGHCSNTDICCSTACPAKTCSGGNVVTQSCTAATSGTCTVGAVTATCGAYSCIATNPTSTKNGSASCATGCSCGTNPNYCLGGNGSCISTDYCDKTGNGGMGTCNAPSATTCPNGDGTLVNCTTAANNLNGDKCVNAGTSPPCGCNTALDCTSRSDTCNPIHNCVCGNTGAPCDAGQTCSGGTCSGTGP